jgi:phosphatidylinositol alpha-mannosyltransferase
VKVGIVVPFSWSFPGGVMAHAHGQARALADLGAAAMVVCGYDPPGVVTQLIHGRSSQREAPPAHVICAGRTIGVPANASTARVVLSPVAFRRLRRVFDREQFDVVHVHDPLTPVLPVAALAGARCPLVTTCHSSGSRWAAVGSRIWGSLTERVGHRIAVSEVARVAASRYLSGPIEVLPNGVDLPLRADPANRSESVVFVGRPERRKGLETLLRVWPSVSRATGARLRIVGPEPREVRKLLRGVTAGGDGIDVLGVVSDHTLRSELASAKMLVAPSIGGESFGLVLVQAFACATPVVCSDIPGFRDVADPAASIRVDPADPGALRSGLLTLLLDDALRQAMGTEARRVAESYAWPRIAARLLDIYESLLR